MGWTWCRTGAGFDVFVVPALRDDAALLDEMLDAVDGAVKGAFAAGDAPESTYTFFLDDDRTMEAALRARGYQDDGTPGGTVLTRDLDDVTDPVLPAGVRTGWVATEDEVAGRVEAQRAAFPSSDLTVAAYGRVRRTWPYRPELDRIVVSDEGAVVAFCTAWLDEQNAAGLLEPVGTHPDHQRRRLASAVTLDALRALRAAGAKRAQVGTSGPAALATYTSVGFRPWRREVTFRRLHGAPPTLPVA